MTREVIERFAQLSNGDGYGWLYSILPPASGLMCRYHKIEKRPHIYGAPLAVCPSCFPEEAR